MNFDNTISIGDCIAIIGIAITAIINFTNKSTTKERINEEKKVLKKLIEEGKNLDSDGNEKDRKEWLEYVEYFCKTYSVDYTNIKQEISKGKESNSFIDIFTSSRTVLKWLENLQNLLSNKCSFKKCKKAKNINQ
jgi:predicted membrane protein